MKRWMGPVWMVGGVLLGAFVTALSLGAIAFPGQTALLRYLPDPLFTRVLMARTASTIVLTSRISDREGSATTLYARPEAYNEFLCSVNIYYFASDASGPDLWSIGPVATTQAFALRTEPDISITYVTSPADVAGPRESSRAARTGCARYRDFGRLINGEYEAIVDAIGLLQRARHAVSQGKSDFDIDCISKIDDRGGVRCDGLVYLRALDLRKIRSVGRMDAPPMSTDDDRTYWVEVEDERPHGHPVITTLILSAQSESDPYGLRVKSIEMARDAH